MATEYKLSYTAADIDDRLRKANEAVLFSEAQNLTDEQKKQVQDNLGIVQPIYPFPTETGTLYPTLKFVDIDKLEVGKLYSRVVDEDKTSTYYIGIKANDGSEKLISLISTTFDALTRIYYIKNSGNTQYNLQSIGGSGYTIINAKSRATSADIVVSTHQLYQSVTSTDLTTTDKTIVGAINELNAEKVDKSEIATDDEIIEMLMDTDMFPVVTDSDGSMLADENGDILLW